MELGEGERGTGVGREGGTKGEEGRVVEKAEGRERSSGKGRIGKRGEVISTGAYEYPVQYTHSSKDVSGQVRSEN